MGAAAPSLTGRARPIAADTATLDVRAIPAQVNRLAWPVVGEQVLQSLVGAVDLAMVGHLGAAALAGVGTALQINNVALAALGALSVGTTALVARATGARQPDEAAHITAQSLLIAVGAGLVMTALGTTFALPLVQLLGAEPSVAQQGTAFLRTLALAAPALVLMLVAGGACRGAGDTRTPMLVSLGMNAINLLLGYSLIFGAFGLPAFGATGAAMATGIARSCGAVVLVAILFRRGMIAGAPWRGTGVAPSWWLPDAAVIRRVLAIGVPSSVEQTMLNGGFLFYGALLISMGTEVYATQRVTFQIVDLSFMPAMGFATAAMTLTGQGLGAGRPDLAQAATRTALKYAVIWMCISGVLFAALAGPMMRIFSNDPQVIALGRVALPVLALSNPFWAINQVYGGSLRGAGDSRFPMFATSLGMWLVRLPSAYFMATVLHWGLPGIYLSSTFDAGLRALLNYLRHRSGRWQRVQV